MLLEAVVLQAMRPDLELCHPFLEHAHLFMNERVHGQILLLDRVQVRVAHLLFLLLQQGVLRRLLKPLEPDMDVLEGRFLFPLGLLHALDLFSIHLISMHNVLEHVVNVRGEQVRNFGVSHLVARILDEKFLQKGKGYVLLLVEYSAVQ